MLGSEMNFVATVIGFAMSVTFIIFICTRIICWKLRGGDSRPMLEIESGGIDDVHRVRLVLFLLSIQYPPTNKLV
ncbi:hypothetical protein LINPERPRIM_LOCUS35694 [Linum perenne]